MKKSILLLFGVFLGMFVSLSFVSAAVVVVAPESDTNHSTVATIFNVTFVNGTDITIDGVISQTSINATFFYNLSGTWTFLGNSSTCSVLPSSTTVACWGTIDVTTLTDGVFSINATLNNGTASANVSASVLTQRVTFDDTAPIVFNGNITSPVSGSSQPGNVVFNVSVADVTIGVGTVFFNVTNSSGEQNGTFTATREGSSPHYSVTVDSNSFPDGSYNITVYANDSLGNLNNSALVSSITFDNTGLAVSNSDINSPSAGSNQSGTLILNVSVSGSDIDTVFFNITNITGTQNATFIAIQEGSTSRYSISIETSGFSDGTYNITVFANDTAGNLNNSALSKDVVFDNTNPSASLSCSPTSVDESNIITCSCSGTDSTSGVSSTSFTAKPSTSTVGSFSTSCTVTDFAGNTVSSTFSYTVQEAGGGSGPGGGTTTTPSLWTSTYSYSENELQEQDPLTRELSEMQRVEVKIENENHHVGVLEVTSTTVKIEVSSHPQEATLSIGESRKFEVTDDNFYDIQVTLNGITDGNADITIEGISEEIPEEEEAVVHPPETTEGEEGPRGRAPGVAIAVILIIALGAWWIWKKKKSS